MSIPRLFQETSIFKLNAINDFVETEIINAEASIKITTDEISSRVTLAEAAISANSSRLTSAESSITQNANAITLKANSTDVYTKTQSDGLISTEVDNRNAAISAAIDSIELSVSQTYTTKTELSSEESKRKASWASCSTGASAQAKIASCLNFQLYSGALISVLFQNTNTHATPTLNVNSTGAKFIRSQTGQALSEGEYKWPAGCVRTFVYDGTYWRFSDDGTIARVTQAEASISINADNIASKVSTTDYTGATVASLINQSADSVKIQANHIVIDGTATFNAIKSSADATYDAIGAAATAKSEAILTAASDATSKAATAKAEAIAAANSAIATLASSTASKTDAIKRTQRIYYQSNNTNAPSTPGTSSSNWVTDTSGSANRWTLKRMSYASATPYIWTCEQKETVSGTVSYTSVLLDDTTTVIDGGKIITGSIAANKLSVYDATIQKIRASAIDTDSITIGYAQITNRPTDVGDLTNNIGYQTNTQVNSSISTAVSSAVYRTQRIYYRTTSSSSTLTGPTTWLSTSGTGYGNWSLKIPPLVSGSTKYPFLYTCVQTQTMAQAANNGTSCNVSAVLLDDTTTVIDGGNIITGSISANKLDVYDATIQKIRASAIDTGSITIGYTQISNRPTDVGDLTNNVGYQTSNQVNSSISTAKLEAISAAASDASTKADTAKSEAISAAASDATSKADTAKAEAISAADSATDTKLESYSTTTAMNTAISTAVDNIDIGGRNLLRNTASPSTNDVILTRATLNGDGTVRLTPTTLAGTITLAGSCKWRVDYLDYADYQNETYTISCDARLADVTSSYTDVLLCMYAVVNAATRLDNVVSSFYDAYKEYTFDTVTTDWQRFSITVNVPTDLTSGMSAALVSGSQLTAQFTAGESTKPLDIRNVKLERGNKPTDWTAAPEDTVNYITTINNTGIMVHPSNDSTSGVKVTDVVDIMRSGVSVAEYSDTARIGKTEQSYVLVQSDGMSVYNNAGSAEIVTLKHKTLTNTGFGELAFLSNGDAYSGGVIKATNGNKFDSISFNVGSSDISTTIMSSDPDNGTSASIMVDGTNSKIMMNSPLCFLAGSANGGSNIIGIYAGSTTATLSNGNWASLASKSTLESKLGSGVTNQNTIIIAQNGDCSAVGNYAFSGAITSDGEARGYVYPAISGSICWNWIAIRFSN